MIYDLRKKPLEKNDTEVYGFTMDYLTDPWNKISHARRDRQDVASQIDPLLEKAKTDKRLDPCFEGHDVFKREDCQHVKHLFKWVLLNWEERSQSNWKMRDKRQLVLQQGGNKKKNSHFLYQKDQLYFNLVLKRLNTGITKDIKSLICSYLNPAFFGRLCFARVHTNHGSWVDEYQKLGLLLDKKNMSFILFNEREDSVWTGYTYRMLVLTGSFKVDQSDLVLSVTTQNAYKNQERLKDDKGENRKSQRPDEEVSIRCSGAENGEKSSIWRHQIQDS